MLFLWVSSSTNKLVGGTIGFFYEDLSPYYQWFWWWFWWGYNFHELTMSHTRLPPHFLDLLLCQLFGLHPLLHRDIKWWVILVGFVVICRWFRVDLCYRYVGIMRGHCKNSYSNDRGGTMMEQWYDTVGSYGRIDYDHEIWLYNQPIIMGATIVNYGEHKDNSLWFKHNLI